MNRLHKKLMARRGSYAKYHKRKYHPHAHWLLLVLVGLLVVWALLTTIDRAGDLYYNIASVNTDTNRIIRDDFSITTAPPTFDESSLFFPSMSTSSTPTTITVKWATNVATSGKVVLNNNQAVSDPKVSTSHQATFSNLTPKTGYTFTITATSADGLSATQNGGVKTK